MSTPTPEILPTMTIWQVFADYGYDGDRLVESFDAPERASAACSRANEHLSQKPPCPSGSEYDGQEWTEHAKADAAWMAAAPYPTYCAESYVVRECAVVISRANPLSPAEAEKIREVLGQAIGLLHTIRDRAKSKMFLDEFTDLRATEAIALLEKAAGGQ